MSNFYVRRVLRLLPALYVVVVAIALFAWATRTWMHTENGLHLLGDLLLLQLLLGHGPSMFTPRLASGFQQLWSLSFEEQFYLVWPWVTIALLTIRTRLRTVVIVLLTLIVLVGVHRAVSFEVAPTGGRCSSGPTLGPIRSSGEHSWPTSGYGGGSRPGVLPWPHGSPRPFCWPA